MKNIGILLPIFSLPTNYGIGDFGPSAYQFIDILKNNKLEYWEVLPLNPIDDFNSPYSPISSTAIEYLFISLDLLVKDGLLNGVECIESSNRINYNEVRILKDKYLRIAFDNLVNNQALYNEYLQYLSSDNEYARFMALKKCNDNKSWVEFVNVCNELEYKYQVFLQFVAHRQWFNLKKYANDNNIKIIGDLPIYVNYESSDVYFHQNDFLLDDKKMSYVSGASPDYFSEEGQKWGHPLYNFNNQKKDNYQYMINKYLYNDKLFDVIRIDHFKAFDAYYKIPIDKSPKYGEWNKNNGDEILDLIFSYVNPDKFIVEDLGSDLEDLYKLRDKYNLCGMKIFEYSFDFTTKSDRYIDLSNMIVYPGNHDNNTVLGWYNSLSSEQKEILEQFLNAYIGSINEKVIKYLMTQPYRYLILMIQDILGLDENYRINIPGIADNQWNYKLDSFDTIDSKLKNLFNE